ncbi:helix-turn-helix transcriptional regulator, partial [Bacillus cereus]
MLQPKIIKKEREKRGLSQDTLARMVGYEDKSSINKIEK